METIKNYGGKNMSSQLSEKSKEKNANLLSMLLADVHQLYIKTLAYHWNVEDPRFFQLHELFDQIYHQLADDLDIVAERIRMLGFRSPVSISKLAELKRLEDTPDVHKALDMIRNLMADHQSMIEWMRQDIEETGNAGDHGTADMITQVLRQFEKNAWFLRSHLEG